MHILAVIRTLSLAVIGALIAGVAEPQTMQTADLSAVAHNVISDCPVALSLNDLEGNPTVLTAAGSLATQMVGRYNSDPAKNQPDLDKEWGVFNAKVLAAMHPSPSCVRASVEAASKIPEKGKELATAAATGTTSQSNKQIGAPASSDGSTSAVGKVGLPQLLGLAVEDGAITSKVSGTTMTLSSTPYAFVVAFGKDQDLDTEGNYNKYQLATRMGISATFNVANASDSLANATRKQVSQWQTKLTFRDTSTRSGAVRRLYYQPNGLDKSGQPICLDKGGQPICLNTAAGAVDAALSDEALIKPETLLEKPAVAVYKQAWSTELEPLVKAAAAGDTDGSQKQGVATKLLQLLDKDTDYQKVLSVELGNVDPNLSTAIGKYLGAVQTYNKLEPLFEKDVQNLTTGWNGDVVFGQKFPTTATTSNATTPSTTSSALGAATASVSSSSATPSIPAYLFAELDLTCAPTKPGGSGAQKPRHCGIFSGGSWTGNFSGSFYTNPNSALNEQTFRGATGALQAQWELGSGPLKIKNANDASKMTLSAACNYQRLQENKDQKGKRPDIALGNLKLEIPISSGVSFPLSFSVANATEQIKETYVKGNFGISFDLDKLASLLKANH